MTEIIDKLTVSSGDSLALVTDAGGTGTLFLKISPGADTITNAGLITIGAGSSLILDGTGVTGTPMGTLTGGGLVFMTGGSVGGTSGGSETLTTDNTIMGFGSVGAKNLVNHGVINASMPMAILTVSSAAAGAVKNVGTGVAGSGTLTATGGGILYLPPGTFDNTDAAHPGTISAFGGSEVLLGSFSFGTTLIKGGTLTTDPGSAFVNEKIATLNGVTLSPGTKYVQGDGTTTNLEGSITNGGVFNVSSTGMAGPALLILDSGDVTLSGTGGMMLGGKATGIPPDPNFVKIQGMTTARLTIGSLQTITGSFQFGSHATAVSPKLTNHGTITAMTIPPGGPPQGITIFPLMLPAPPIADAVINDGTMQASDNSFLTFNNGIVTNSLAGVGGMIVAHGTMMPGMVILQEGATVNDGTILLDGPLSQLQLNNGTARPTTLTNSTGGMIFTVAPSTANTLGGVITNSGPGSSILVKDNSSLTMDNASLGGSVTNSSFIQVGTGAVPVGPAALTINSGSLTNFVMAASGMISVAANGTLTLVGTGAAGGNAIINGGMVSITGAPGTINLNNGTIHGGTLNIPANGLVTTVGASMNNFLGGTVNNFFNGTIRVVANSQLYLEAGGTYNNSGTIVLSGAAGNAASLRPSGFGGTVSLTGSNIVNLGGNFVDNFIFGDKGNERLINVDNTIIGGGTIGASNMSLTNKADGVISATAGAGITINPNADGVINGGTIKTGGATLNLMTGTFTNFDGANLGTIAANPGDQLNLTGGAGRPAIINGGIVNVNANSGGAGILNLSMGTIHGGTLNNFGTINSLAGPVNTLGGTVNNNAGITVNAGATLDLETTGTYNNAGLISINAAAGSSLRVNGANGTATLNGNGGIVTLLGAGSSILGANGNETLLNQTNTINGGGSLGAGSLAITNRSLISATNGAVNLTIQPNATGVTNSGTIQANGGLL